MTSFQGQKCVYLLNERMITVMFIKHNDSISDDILARRQTTMAVLRQPKSINQYFSGGMTDVLQGNNLLPTRTKGSRTVTKVVGTI